MRGLTCAACFASNCGDLSSSTLSRFQTTASALKSEPSWNLTPLRSVKRQTFVSFGSTFHSVARPGTSLPGRVAMFASQAISGS